MTLVCVGDDARARRCARARAGAAGEGARSDDGSERSPDDLKKKLSKKLESVKATSMAKFSGSSSDFDEHDDDELVAGVLTKKATKNVMLLVALVAAVASVTYLVTMVSMNAERGLADVLYTLVFDDVWANIAITVLVLYTCLLYTSPSPRDATLSRMPSSA